MVVLDTCTLIFDALTPQRLSRRARRAISLEEARGGLSCSDISLWEVAMLVERGRLDPGTDTLTFLRLVRAARGIVVLPITPEIAHRSAVLPVHGDPADRIIAATAIERGATLVTSDRPLRSNPAVPTLW